MDIFNAKLPKDGAVALTTFADNPRVLRPIRPHDSPTLGMTPHRPRDKPA